LLNLTFSDEEDVDFEATFDLTSRAHFAHVAEKSTRTFKFTEINTQEYWSEMCRLIVKWFDRRSSLSIAHYNTFTNNMARHGGLKRQGAKPDIECWFLVAGKVREGFDAKTYLNTYPWIEDELRGIRRHLDIIVEKKDF